MAQDRKAEDPELVEEWADAAQVREKAGQLLQTALVEWAELVRA